MPKLVAGMAAVLETRVALEPGGATGIGVRLWLKSPEGRRSVVEPVETVTAEGDAGMVTLRAAPVLPTPGIWEWQFEVRDAAGKTRVLEHGRLFVRATGFTR